MPRQGVRFLLFLVFVFPAIVAATLALSTYGFRYAKSASERSKASLMDGNRQLAQALAGSIQQRIDTADFELFKQIEWEDSDQDPPSEIELPKGVESVAVLDKDLHIRAIMPATTGDPKQRSREQEHWPSYVRGLDWMSLQPWTPAQPGGGRRRRRRGGGRAGGGAGAAGEAE